MRYIFIILLPFLQLFLYPSYFLSNFMLFLPQKQNQIKKNLEEK